MARDAFFWHLFVASDSLGMMPETPASMAEALSDEKLKVSIRAATAAIDELCAGEKPALLRYTDGGKPFLVFRKFQDHQKIRYDVAPACPLPPVETLEKLSPKTRQLLCSNFGVTYVAATAKSAATVTVTVTVTEKKSADSVVCRFCEKPTKNPLQAIHDIYREIRGECPLGLMAAPKAHGVNRSKWSKILGGDELLHACLREYCRSDDPFVVNAGYPLSLFWSEHTMQGLRQKVQAAEKKREADKARRERNAAQQKALEGKG